MFNYKTVHCFFWFCLFYCPVSKKPYARRGSNRDHSLWVQRNLQWVVGAGRGVSVEVWMALKVNDRVYSECIFIEQQLESTPLSLSLSLPLLSLSLVEWHMSGITPGNAKPYIMVSLDIEGGICIEIKQNTRITWVLNDSLRSIMMFFSQIVKIPKTLTKMWKALGYSTIFWPHFPAAPVLNTCDGVGFGTSTSYLWDSEH